MRENRMAAIAAVLCGTAVALGALGAHALKSALSPESLESFETGVRYQMWHGLALLALSLGIFGKNSSVSLWANRLMLSGTIIFSGSIYLLATKSLHGWETLCRIFGPLTPVGGLLMISAWIILAAGFFRK